MQHNANSRILNLPTLITGIFLFHTVLAGATQNPFLKSLSGCKTLDRNLLPDCNFRTCLTSSSGTYESLQCTNDAYTHIKHNIVSFFQEEETLNNEYITRIINYIGDNPSIKPELKDGWDLQNNKNQSIVFYQHEPIAWVDNKKPENYHHINQEERELFKEKMPTASNEDIAKEYNLHFEAIKLAEKMVNQKTPFIALPMGWEKTPFKTLHADYHSGAIDDNYGRKRFTYNCKSALYKRHCTTSFTPLSEVLSTQKVPFKLPNGDNKIIQGLMGQEVYSQFQGLCENIYSNKEFLPSIIEEKSLSPTPVNKIKSWFINNAEAVDELIHNADEVSELVENVKQFKEMFVDNDGSAWLSEQIRNSEIAIKLAGGLPLKDLYKIWSEYDSQRKTEL